MRISSFFSFTVRCWIIIAVMMAACISPMNVFAVNAKDACGGCAANETCDALNKVCVRQSSQPVDAGSLQEGAAAIRDTSLDNVLGSGFEEITRYGSTADNATLTARGGAYMQGGVGQINAILYNAADYFKYIAGSLAVLWLVISAFRLVAATADDDIKHARKGIIWGLIALVFVFSIHIFIITFFENGQSRATDLAPAQSLVAVTSDPAKVAEIEKSGKGYIITTNGQKIAMSLSYDTQRDLFRTISNYFLVDVRNFFEWLKVIGGGLAIFMIFTSGVMMVNAGGNEEGIEKGKKYLLHTVTAFTTLLMLDFLIFKGIYPANEITTTTADGQTVTLVANEPECLEYFSRSTDSKLFGSVGRQYTVQTTNGQIVCDTAARIAQTINETYIIRAIRFFETLIGGVSVFFLVLGGVRLVGAFGNEEVMTKEKKQIGYSIGGLAVVLLAENVVRKFLFVTNYGDGVVKANAQQGIIDIAGITNFVSTFVAAISFVSILIAGIFWVANFGNDEIAGKSKKAILYAVAGLLLSIAAYGLVQTLIVGKSVSAGDNINIRANVSNGSN